MMTRWLIAYDVAHPQRLQRLYRLLSGYALPMQNSVFLFIGNEQDLSLCLQKVGNIIHPKYDDVKVYCLPSLGLLYSAGVPTLPTGMILSPYCQPLPWAQQQPYSDAE